MKKMYLQWTLGRGMTAQEAREGYMYSIQPERLRKGYKIRRSLGRVLKAKPSLDSLPFTSILTHSIIKGLVTRLLYTYRSPSIMGILAANRPFLGKIGSLDGGMLVYGGEGGAFWCRYI